MPKKMCNNIALGKNIKNIRRSLNYTQEQFAEKLEISSQFLSQVERDIAGISLDTAIKICQIANCSPSLLFKDIITVTNPLEKYELLSENNKKIINDMIEILLKNHN